MLTFHRVDFPNALWIADNLRPEDARELETATGLSAQEAVFRSLASSSYAYMSAWNGTPHSLFGVAQDPQVPNAGIVWMVGTREIERSPIATYKEAKKFLPVLHKEFPLLWNRVDNRNTLHIKWLKALGFTFGDTEQVNGQDFTYFYRLSRG